MIKEFLKNNRLTKRYLAAKFEVTEQTIRNWEISQRNDRLLAYALRALQAEITLSECTRVHPTLSEMNLIMRNEPKQQ